MKIRRKILKYFGLIDSYERIIELERIVVGLTDRVFELEQATGLKDSYIDSIVKKNKNK